MSYFAFLAIGLLLGVAANRLIPARKRDDWIAPLFIGGLGALFGGWISSVIFWSNTSLPFSAPNWISAAVVAVVLLGVYVIIERVRAPKDEA